MVSGLRRRRTLRRHLVTGAITKQSADCQPGSNAMATASKHYFSAAEEARMQQEDSFTWRTVMTILIAIVLMGFLGMSLTVLITLLGS
jgi:hypothetical protein